MRKRILAVVLCLVLAVSVFVLASCKDDETVVKGAYILSDKGTYLAYKKNAEGDKIPNLTLLYEQDDALRNTYSMIAVDADGAGFAGKSVTINEAGADAFIRWMSLAATREVIADFGKKDYDEALFYLIADAQTYSGAVTTFAESGLQNNAVRVSTTTSVNDTGLLGALETLFEGATGWDLQVASAGTGAAIQAAKDGNADLLVVHSASQERAFVDEGYARVVEGLSGTAQDASYPARISFMYNYFVLLGAPSDPAKVKDAATIVDAVKAIAAKGSAFVSRGDKSGTHTAETNLWAKTGLPLVDIDLEYTSKGETLTGTAKAPSGAWYVSAGQGMGACLTMANELPVATIVAEK